jgi:tetratricopeptide (TPR) repeat protein
MSMPRLTVARLVRVWLIVGSLALGLASTPLLSQKDQDPVAREMTGDTGPKTAPPDQRAMDSAMQIANLTDRMVALDKVRRDYPQSALQSTIDANLLSGVLQMPDAEDSALEIIERMMARVPATASADARIQEAGSIASRLIGRKMMLDRAEALLVAALEPKTLSKSNRAAGQYWLGRLYVTRGDAVRAEAAFRAAIDAPPAVSALVSLYVERGETDKAEEFLSEVVKATPVNVAALSSLVNLYKNDAPRAEALLRDAVTRDPMLTAPLLQLARLEQQRGDTATALDHFLGAAALSYLRDADATALNALWVKEHGSAAGLDDAINARFRALPPALHADRYTPSARRSTRLVVLEMFTGSACPPCVAADIAFDAALERYGADAIIPLAYHVHIPAPDPMTTPEGDARRKFYNVNGVPTMHVDGAMVTAPGSPDNLGGGGRDRAPEVFNIYAGTIDKSLESAATAAVAVRATITGDKVSVTADVSALPSGMTDATLHLVLAEKVLLFGGENGMRGHHMVVRGVAGVSGQGLPLAKTGTTQFTFDLAQIRDGITRSLAADISRRGGQGPFAAADHAMTKIDPAQLVAVAFIQAPNKNILQAARADVGR